VGLSKPPKFPPRIHHPAVSSSNRPATANFHPKTMPCIRRHLSALQYCNQMGLELKCFAYSHGHVAKFHAYPALFVRHQISNAVPPGRVAKSTGRLHLAERTNSRRRPKKRPLSINICPPNARACRPSPRPPCPTVRDVNFDRVRRDEAVSRQSTLLYVINRFQRSRR